MIGFMLRTLGIWLIAGAIAAVVVDGMKTIGAGSPRLTSFSQTMFEIAPALHAGFRKWAEAHWGLAAWGFLAETLLAVPSSIMFLILGFALVALGSRRARSAAYVV